MAVRHASSQQFQWHDLAEIITAISKDAAESPIMLLNLHTVVSLCQVIFRNHSGAVMFTVIPGVVCCQG